LKHGVVSVFALSIRQCESVENCLLAKRLVRVCKTDRHTVRRRRRTSRQNIQSMCTWGHC